MTAVDTIIIAIVEGLTEFLPVSSTGHMIVTQYILGIPSSEFVKTFTVAVQLGAILAVVLMYWKRFFTNDFSFYFKLLLGFIPAAIVELTAGDYLDGLLGNVVVVAASLVIGGVILIFIDGLINGNDEEKVTFPKAFIIGVFQCLALIPGVSRSAATIIGGMSQRLTRKAAAEFSFFLAVPTMFAATAKKVYDFYKHGNAFSNEEIKHLLLGNAVALIVAIVAVKFFIAVLNRHGFKFFGYYRIIAGGIILALYFAGYQMTVD
jgi:undecaprenyl-diphosphatase